MLNLRGCTLEAGRLDQLGLQKAFAMRPIEQDLIPVHVPYCREPGRSWPVQTVNHPALPPATSHSAFGHRKRTYLKLVMLAKGKINVLSKVIQTGNLVKPCRHGWERSPECVRNVHTTGNSAQGREDSVSADSRYYRQFRAISFASSNAGTGPHRHRQRPT